MTSELATLIPSDAISGNPALDIISPDQAPTLDQLFRERVRRSSARVAYTEYDDAAGEWVDRTWDDIAVEVGRWQVAFREQGLEKGDRVAIRLRNCCDWVVFDQAALRLGLVVVPLYVADRPDNVSYVLENSATSLLLVENLSDWHEIRDTGDDLSCLQRVLFVGQGDPEDDPLVARVKDWLPDNGQNLERGISEADDLASIVYTSGTTGRPKGVMLSHRNMVENAYSGLRSVPLSPEDEGLSFLPLSHTFERTIGYYAQVMSGARITYNRDIPLLGEDMKLVKPTVMISVPRIFERVLNHIQGQLDDGPGIKRWLFKQCVACGWRKFEYSQGRAGWHPSLLWQPLLDVVVARKVREEFGGRLRMVIVGGAALSEEVGRTFVSLGIQLIQGYGLTETSPVITVNTEQYNRPDSIGLPVRGVEVRIGENDELLARGSNVMLGYWRNEEATKAAIDADGWLHSGDQAAVDDGYLRIIGRLKEILVLANGEKVPPVDMEQAIMQDPLFQQVLVIGEGKPFLSALMVLDRPTWERVSREQGLGEAELDSDSVHALLVERVAERISEFPGYAKIHRVFASLDEWTVEDGLVTPTLKVKRPKVIERFQQHIDRMYEGH